MKLEIIKKESIRLPRFIVGALATAGASSASGATVQITFANNLVDPYLAYIWSWPPDFISDLTGDGVPDVGYDYHWNGDNSMSASVYNLLDGAEMALARFDRRWFAFASWVVGGVRNDGVSGMRRDVVPFTFEDSRVNGGLLTAGWLDVSAVASAVWPTRGATVQIHRLIFDEALTTAPTGVDYADAAYPEWQVSAVPEPGSNLALLALGAGGLTLRRRLKRVA